MATERIDHLYTLARRSGAIGGKLVGAGGGGFLLVYARRPDDTRQAMAAAQAPELPFDFEFQGALRQRVCDESCAAARRDHRLRPDRAQARGGARRAVTRSSAASTSRPAAAEPLAREHGATACASADELLALGADVVIVAVTARPPRAS